MVRMGAKCTPAYWALNRHLTIIFGTVSYISYLCWPSVEHYGGFSGISFSTVLAGADPGFGNGGAKISSEASNIYERSELRAKRVTSEASINQLEIF